MAGDNKNKSLDQTVLNDESFGQQPFDDWPPLTGGSPKRTDDEVEPVQSGNKAPPEQRQTFDAEDFSSFAAEPPSLDNEDPEDHRETQISSSTISLEGAETKTGAPRTFKRLKAAKSIRIGLAAVLFIALVGSAIGYWYPKWRSPAASTGFIRHSIIVPSYKEQLKFLVLADTQDAKSLFNMALTFEFRAVNSHQQFRKNRLAFKDAVYQYLAQLQSAENTKPYWQKVVGKDLLINLRARFPQCGIVSAQVTDLENL